MVSLKKLLPLYKNLIAMVCSADFDINLFDIVAKVLLDDTLT